MVNDISEGLQNVKQISRRMVKSFCEILCLTEKLDFSTSSKLNNTYRVSIRENEETIQSKGFIATAATSLWFPFAFKTIFNFLKDDKTRYQVCIELLYDVDNLYIFVLLNRNDVIDNMLMSYDIDISSNES